MADTKISALTALDQSTADPAKTYVPLFHQDGSPLNRRMNFTNLRVGSFLYAGASGSAARFSSAGNGVAVLTNDAGNDLSRVCFGGTTSLFPAFKRNGAALHLRLADDSAFANLQLDSLNVATITNGTLTGGSSPALNVTQTWNNAATTFTSLLVNVTNINSNLSSKLLDLQTGSVTQFSVARNGVVTCSNVITSPFFATDSTAVAGLYARSSTAVVALGINDDVQLTRDAAERLALRRSSNAQRFAVYRTWSAADNFERGVMSWYDSSTNDGVAGTTLRIGTEKGSVGGTARNVSIVADGSDRLIIKPDNDHVLIGNLRSSAVSTYDLGMSGVPWRTVFANKIALGASDMVAIEHQSNLIRVTNNSTGPGVFAIDNVQGTNFERLKAEWDTNVARFGTSKGGSGTARDFAIITDNTVRVTFAAAGGQTAADGHNMAFGTSTGTKIGTATGQKIGFWNATPVVQQVLATGAGATVDNVITLLQTLGLCKQS
jgi:hypothetical protein